MYLVWNEKTVTDFSDENINSLYNAGYVFTRPAKGLMKQTRSIRIDLSKFELSSENRRILRKTEHIKLKTANLPYSDYDWTIGKMAKDFYTTKFGDGTFSANKTKELITDPKKSNFNQLFVYTSEDKPIGYCIVAETNEMIHYCYPFYDLDNNLKDTGLGMMIRAVVFAKENNKKYIYLGSFQRPTDTYKLQFSGIEWFDGEEWNNSLEELKTITQ